jgi:hypothetical protein
MSPILKLIIVENNFSKILYPILSIMAIICEDWENFIGAFVGI